MCVLAEGSRPLYCRHRPAGAKAQSIFTATAALWRHGCEHAPLPSPRYHLDSSVPEQMRKEVMKSRRVCKQCERRVELLYSRSLLSRLARNNQGEADTGKKEARTTHACLRIDFVGQARGHGCAVN